MERKRVNFFLFFKCFNNLSNKKSIEKVIVLWKFLSLSLKKSNDLDLDNFNNYFNNLSKAVNTMQPNLEVVGVPNPPTNKKIFKEH